MTRLLTLLALWPGLAWSAEPIGGLDNLCDYPDVHEGCTTAADCVGNDYASLCVEHVLGDAASRRCEIPCEQGGGVAVTAANNACAIGETCVETRATPGRKAFYCQPSRFRVDLNLLDQCVTSHLEGLAPTFSENTCSLETNLTNLLDQNGDRSFDIFDLDLCVLSFLEQPGCDPDTGVCDADDLVACAADDDCGQGLYCDLERHTCQRDCGVIAAREVGFSELERQCAGNGKVCDLDRGRCVDIDVTRQTCDVDSDCPAGSNCFLGRCASNCYRSLDCPSGGWYCAENNRCRALPSPDADSAFVFDPKNYAIRFARDQLTLGEVDNSDASNLIILDLITKKSVFGNASVGFGYRLELSYSIKEDRKCLRPFVDCADANQRPAGEDEATCRARQDDCFVDDTEQWVRLDSPFGVVNAAAGASIGVTLDEAAVARLSPGVYRATLRAIFDNGDSDTISVSYTKASPSGEYDGQVSVYLGTPDYPLNGSRPMGFTMRIKVYDDQPRRWNELLAEYHLGSADGDEASFVDITRGFLVHGLLDSESAFAYQATGSTSAGAEVPFVGLYSPDLKRMRLIGLIDVAADFCLAADGACDETDDSQLRVTNPFGRTVRRQIEFIGPFDDRIGRFHGIYREKITGLEADTTLTMDGGFILDQVLGDDSPLPVTDDSILLANTPAVGFPSNAEVLADLATANAAACAKAEGGTDALSRFADTTAFDNYIRSARRRGATATSTNPTGRTTIFPNVRKFEDSIAEALRGIGATSPSARASQLNVYDFLEEYIGVCSEDSDAPVCVQDDVASCGLGLMQKAIVSGWVDLDDVQGSAANPVTGELDLFCPDTLEISGCPAEASSNVGLFALQEHNRFWLDRAQAKKLEADKARSDAFLVLFRNAINPFAVGAALSYKADRLREAVRGYDEVLAMIVGTPAAKVLFSYPAKAFRSTGREWLDIMHQVVSDRMDTLAELVDLERRVFLSAGQSEFAFAQHFMQHEYLVQVYLMALQARWEGASFAYEGWASRVIEKGENITAQLNPTKNAIGVTPDQVFFENSSLTRNNWTAYKDLVVGDDGQGGLVAEGQALVADAVANLQASLADLDALGAALGESADELAGTLDEICGSAEATTSTCQTLISQYNSSQAWEKARDCAFQGYIEKNGAEASAMGMVKRSDCPANSDLSADYECDITWTAAKGNNPCKEIVKTFFKGTNIAVGAGSPTSSNPICALDPTVSFIEVDGKKRPCVGGEVGALMQEQAAVELERKLLLKSLWSVLSSMNSLYDKVLEIKHLDDDFEEEMRGLTGGIIAANTVANVLEIVVEMYEDVAEAAGCLTIAGMALGTDCPQELASKAAIVAGKANFWQARSLFMLGSEVMAAFQEFEAYAHDTEIGHYEGFNELMGMVREADGLIESFKLLTQSSFNLTVALDDARWRAREAVVGYSESVTDVADHLLGRETGNPLLGQALVLEASNKFREVLQVMHRMTVAYVHNYNLSDGDARQLIARSQAVVTFEEAAAFVRELTDRERAYCGLSGLDCDYVNNTETLRISLRDVLFPNLRDIVDARTGEVLTAGQQFHNLITQPPFLVRRIRANQLTDQIEIPFPVSLTALENTPTGSPRWLVDPLSCNHLLDPRDPTAPTGTDVLDGGTVAVNLVGENLDAERRVVRYQLVRGSTDFIRGCQLENQIGEIGTLPTLDYSIHRHTVGYAPQHLEAKRDTPASYVSVSSPFTACINSGESLGSLDAGACWRYFARDRSLAAPDWKLVIPLVVGNADTDSGWLIGDGLSAVEAPLVEDIIVYFRYRSRPVEEN